MENIRPIDANALSRKIYDYMAECPTATARLTACRAILSMLGDENQTPTLSGIAPDCNGEPLTLEQLREMDGKPVYFERGKSWGIVSVDSNGRWEGVPFFVTCKDGVKFIHNIKLRKMKVYEYPPARIDREKWELCEWCGSVGKTPDNWVCTLEDENGHTVTNQHIVVCATANYCPSCGRPLTPEAWEEMERRING